MLLQEKEILQMGRSQALAYGSISNYAIIEVQTRLSGKTHVEDGSWIRAKSKLNEAHIGERCFIGFATSINFGHIADCSIQRGRIHQG